MTLGGRGVVPTRQLEWQTTRFPDSRLIKPRRTRFSHTLAPFQPTEQPKKSEDKSIKTQREAYYDALIRITQPHRVPQHALTPPFLNVQKQRDWVDAVRCTHPFSRLQPPPAAASSAREPVPNLGTLPGPEIACDAPLLSIPERSERAPWDTRTAILARMFKVFETEVTEDEQKTDADAPRLTGELPPISATELQSLRAAEHRAAPVVANTVAQRSKDTASKVDASSLEKTAKKKPLLTSLNDLDKTLDTLSLLPLYAHSLAADARDVSSMEDAAEQLKHRTLRRAPLAHLPITRRRPVLAPSSSTTEEQPQIFVVIGDSLGPRFQKLTHTKPEKPVSTSSRATQHVAVQTERPAAPPRPPTMAAAASKTTPALRDKPVASLQLKKTEKKFKLRKSSIDLVEKATVNYAPPALGQPEPWPEDAFPFVINGDSLSSLPRAQQPWQAVPRTIPHLVLPDLRD